MSFPIETQPAAGHRTEIPSPDDFADALMEEWAPALSPSINERRAMTENPATLRLARSF
ncbi:MAG: hypothetical protein JWO33_229 [Caulobacteraceae bacterium]|nr:hypothetical protein [Caulobacteraceae bacterium]